MCDSRELDALCEYGFSLEEATPEISRECGPKDRNPRTVGGRGLGGAATSQLVVLTWIVLGSFPPREPFSLTYISHPLNHVLIVFYPPHPPQGQAGEQGSHGLPGMKGEQVSSCQSKSLEVHLVRK